MLPAELLNGLASLRRRRGERDAQKAPAKEPTTIRFGRRRSGRAQGRRERWQIRVNETVKDRLKTSYRISTAASPAAKDSRRAGKMRENASSNAGFLHALPDPNDLRRDAALPVRKRLKILILGDNDEVARKRVLPDGPVVRSFKPDSLDMDAFPPVDTKKPGQCHGQLIVDWQLGHAAIRMAWSVCTAA